MIPADCCSPFAVDLCAMRKRLGIHILGSPPF